MLYRDIDTGEVFTIEELKEIYEQQKDEMSYDSFDDYMDEALTLGINKICGLEEIL